MRNLEMQASGSSLGKLAATRNLKIETQLEYKGNTWLGLVSDISCDSKIRLVSLPDPAPRPSATGRNYGSYRAHIGPTWALMSPLVQGWESVC